MYEFLSMYILGMGLCIALPIYNASGSKVSISGEVEAAHIISLIHIRSLCDIFYLFYCST